MELNSNETTPTSFWHRQFSDHPTGEQIIYDIMVGILAPLVCLIADPAVFRSSAFMDEIFCSRGPVVDNPLSPHHLVIFAYSLIGLGMLALLIWLIAGRWLGPTSAIFAGIFMTGAGSAFTLGIVLLPLSIAGLYVLIGVCGFTPLLTSFVYLRNGIRAWRIARQHKPTRSFRWLLALALAASLAVYVIPAYIQWQAWVSFPDTRTIPTPPPCPADP